jgi:hypothetical protein
LAVLDVLDLARDAAYLFALVAKLQPEPPDPDLLNFGEDQQQDGDGDRQIAGQR